MQLKKDMDIPFQILMSKPLSAANALFICRPKSIPALLVLLHKLFVVLLYKHMIQVFLIP